MRCSDRVIRRCLALVLALSLTTQTIGAQCLSNMGSREIASDGAFGDTQDVVILVRLDSSLGSAAYGAAEDAIADWNYRTSQTRVKFQITTSPYADLVIDREDGTNGDGGTNANPLGCMFYDHNGRVGITKNVNDNNTRNEMAPMIRHELGHYLGIDDLSASSSPPTSIMVQLQMQGNEDCSSTLANRYQRGANTSWVENWDADTAADCLTQAWSGRSFDWGTEEDVEKEIPEWDGGGTCIQRWYVQEVYQCSYLNGNAVSCSITDHNFVYIIDNGCPPSV